MIRLGVRLTFRGGRESLTRLILTALAVALGVTVLLGVLSEFNAYQRVSGRACWECTTGRPLLAGGQIPAGDQATAELWNFRLDFHQGSEIRRLDVAPLGSQAPVLPTLSRNPAPGEYYVSPALAALLAHTPHDQLGDRFPGTEAGLLGTAALTGPDELAVVVGRRPGDLTALPNTMMVDALSTSAEPAGTTVIYRFAFAFGTVAVFLPLLILVGTATRLSAARREERYAAMRLVGSTPRQIGVLAAVEAFLAAALGTALGVVAFVALRSQLTHVTITGTRFFPDTVTPKPAGYLGIAAGVPVLAAVAAVWALRRVRLDPLGVTRRQTPKPVRAWRTIPLALGIAIWIVGQAVQAGGGGDGHSASVAPDASARLVYLCTPLVMIGLVLAGPWVTLQSSRVLRRRGGAAALLASRRLADDPRAAFRNVNGLAVAVFVGTVIAGLLPTALHAATGGARAPLANVLRARYDEGASAPGSTAPAAWATGPGLSPADATRILAGLDTIPGVTAIGVRVDMSVRLPLNPPPGAAPPPGARSEGPPIFVARCADLRTLPALGACAPGADVTEIDADDLFRDNPLRLQIPAVFPTENHARPGTDVDRLPLTQLLVTAATPAALEQARTYLSNHAAIPTGATSPDAWATDAIAPMTFGEVAGLRATIYTAAQKMVVFAIILTLVVAACSLTVATAGSLVERRRPFTLLRLSGAPGTSLAKVVFLESALPLAAAATTAALTGYAMARAAIGDLAPHAAMTFPAGTYFSALAAGTVAAALVIGGSLSLLGRMTRTDNARFE